jgi:hypothetical protein
MKKGPLVILASLLLVEICYGEKPWPEMTYEERVTFIKQEELSDHVVCKDLVMPTTSFGQYSYECRRRKELAEIEKEDAKRRAEIAKQPRDTQQMINSKEIKLGMTKEQVLLSWGKPDRINRDVGRWGANEQWCYGSKTYLYFENGILTSFQDQEEGGKRMARQ